MGPRVADSILPVVDSSVPGILVPGDFTLLGGCRTGAVEIWDHVVPDLDLPRAFVVLGGRAEGVGVEEGPQVVLGAVYEVSPVCHQYLHLRVFGEDNLQIIRHKGKLYQVNQGSECPRLEAKRNVILLNKQLILDKVRVLATQQ